MDLPDTATIKQLLEAGAHFGHQTGRWHPRMKNYIFTKRNGIHIIDLEKTAVMLDKVCKVDTIITNTEKEALILEASLIKRHRPKYNIILRDDKSYPLIKVTVQEEWPRVHMTRKKKRDGARYFGPYSSSSAMWTTLNLLQKIFPLRRCKGSELSSCNGMCNGQSCYRGCI